MTLSEVLLERAKANIAWDDRKFWHKLSLSSRAGTPVAIKNAIGSHLKAKGFDKSIAGLKAYSELHENPEIRPFSVDNTFKDFPDGLDNAQKPLVLSHKKIAILSDIHLGFHDKAALMSALSIAKKNEVECLYLNGDVCDTYSLSRHEKTPGKLSLKAEIELTKQFFGFLRQEFPKIDIVFKSGNHEDRLERFILSKCPELVEIFGWTMFELSEAKNFGFIEVGTSQVSTFGKLTIAHGHEGLYFGGGVTPARNTRLKSGNIDMVIGHVHRISTDIFRGLDGKVTRSYSTGCLCKLNPDYVKAGANWQHGMAIVERDGFDYFLQNIEIR